VRLIKFGAYEQPLLGKREYEKRREGLAGTKKLAHVTRNVKNRLPNWDYTYVLGGVRSAKGMGGITQNFAVTQEEDTEKKRRAKKKREENREMFRGCKSPRGLW